jgi:hypothetical protein
MGVLPTGVLPIDIVLFFRLAMEVSSSVDIWTIFYRIARQPTTIGYRVSSFAEQRKRSIGPENFGHRSQSYDFGLQRQRCKYLQRHEYLA